MTSPGTWCLVRDAPRGRTPVLSWLLAPIALGPCSWRTHIRSEHAGTGPRTRMSLASRRRSAESPLAVLLQPLRDSLRPFRRVKWRPVVVGAVEDLAPEVPLGFSVVAHGLGSPGQVEPGLVFGRRGRDRLLGCPQRELGLAFGQPERGDDVRDVDDRRCQVVVERRVDEPAVPPTPRLVVGPPVTSSRAWRRSSIPSGPRASPRARSRRKRSASTMMPSIR